MWQRAGITSPCGGHHYPKRPWPLSSGFEIRLRSPSVGFCSPMRPREEKLLKTAITEAKKNRHAFEDPFCVASTRPPERWRQYWHPQMTHFFLLTISTDLCARQRICTCVHMFCVVRACSGGSISSSTPLGTPL